MYNKYIIGSARDYKIITAAKKGIKVVEDICYSNTSVSNRGTQSVEHDIILYATSVVQTSHIVLN